MSRVLLTAALAVFAATLPAAASTIGVTYGHAITAADGLFVPKASLNYLTPGSATDVTGQAHYFSPSTSDVNLNGHDAMAGTTAAITGSVGVIPGGGPSSAAAPDAYFGAIATAGGPSGILRSSSYGAAASVADDAYGNPSASANSHAYASIGDTLNITTPGNFTLSGHFDGLLNAPIHQGTDPDGSDATVTLNLYIIDTATRSEDGGYAVLGGYTYDRTLNSFTGPVSANIDESFNVTVPLDAGNYFFYAELKTEEDISVNAGAGGLASSEFGHTLSFALTDSSGNAVPSSLNLVPAVPEPAAVSLLAPAVLLLSTRRRRTTARA